MKLWYFILIIVIAFLALSIPVYSDGIDQEETGEIKDRISTDGLAGISLALVNLYNDHRFVYAILVTVSMAVFGGLIAIVVDTILARLGFTVSKMEHRE